MKKLLFGLVLTLGCSSAEPEVIKPHQGDFKIGVDPTKVFNQEEFCSIVGGTSIDPILNNQKVEGIKRGLSGAFVKIEVAWRDGSYLIYKNNDGSFEPHSRPGWNLYLAEQNGVIVGGCVLRHIETKEPK